MIPFTTRRASVSLRWSFSPCGWMSSNFISFSKWRTRCLRVRCFFLYHKFFPNCSICESYFCTENNQLSENSKTQIPNKCNGICFVLRMASEKDFVLVILFPIAIGVGYWSLFVSGFFGFVIWFGINENRSYKKFPKNSIIKYRLSVDHLTWRTPMRTNQ